MTLFWKDIAENLHFLSDTNRQNGRISSFMDTHSTQKMERVPQQNLGFRITRRCDTKQSVWF